MELPDTPAARLARQVIDRLHSAGYQAYLVGGCVRDLLLGRQPEDFDIATDARPEEVLHLFPKAELVGAHFGVALVRDGEAHVQVATFRSDDSYLDGRHPTQVRYEDRPEEDVKRRDFTVNALMYDVQSGRVRDFVDGQRDLEARLIRTVGDPEARFAEDHLRMLRAVRFAAALRFTIHPDTFDAIRRLKSRIRRVSAERIRDEIFRILTEGGARYGFELLDESGLLEELLPEVAALKGVRQPPEYHPEGDVWTHTLLMLERMEKPTVALALGVLLHDVGKPPTFRETDRIRFHNHAKVGAEMAAEICRRLRCSREITARVAALARDHLKFIDVKKMRPATLKRFLREPHFEELLELHRLDCLASHGNLENYEFCKRKLAELSEQDLRPKPLITGRDLIAAGYRPGPAFRRMLEAVETAQLEGKLDSPAAALAFVRSRFLPPDGRPAPQPATRAGT